MFLTDRSDLSVEDEIPASIGGPHATCEEIRIIRPG